MKIPRTAPDLDWPECATLRHVTVNTCWRRCWRNAAVYKHCRKQIYVVIAKSNNKVSSRIRHIYENFLSYDSSDRAYIYARIYEFSYVRKFRESRYARKNLRTQNLRTETGVRTSVNSTPGYPQ